MKELDYETLSIPLKALDAVSFFSKVLGEYVGFSPPKHDDGHVAPFISFGGSNGYLAHLSFGPDAPYPWTGEDPQVSFDPESEEDWAKVYTCIGYCAYHKITWEAP